MFLLLVVAGGHGFTRQRNRQLRTRKIASSNELNAAAIHWYTNKESINISITTRGKRAGKNNTTPTTPDEKHQTYSKWCDITLDAPTLKKLIAELQTAHDEILRGQSVGIWYKDKTIGVATLENNIYTFHASGELDEAAMEYARREVETMNQIARRHYE